MYWSSSLFRSLPLSLKASSGVPKLAFLVCGRVNAASVWGCVPFVAGVMPLRTGDTALTVKCRKLDPHVHRNRDELCVCESRRMLKLVATGFVGRGCGIDPLVSGDSMEISQSAGCWLQAQNGSLFPAAVLTLYCTYLCYSALTSEPHDDPCNGLGHKLNAASASTLAIGMALALLAVVYSALRAGSNTHLFGFGSEDGDGPAEQPLMEEGGSAGPDDERKSSTGDFSRQTSPLLPLSNISSFGFMG